MNCDLKVFYDGHCPICSREIKHLKKQEGAERISFIDFTDHSFDAAKENLDSEEIHKKIHGVLLVDGKIITGMDTLIAIWKRIPRYHWLGVFASIPGIHFMFRIGYAVFSKFRPRLQKKK
ncbi:MAG: DUF393 domain-containing protein [Deltaproteobacteria bacterium]|nr:DUF393 domain-containing protein [Deltaproteobacteria bacterium]